MEFKGTKGKWYIDVEESGINEHGAKFLSISSQIGKAKSKGIADVYESVANAKLISCAPELLEMSIRFEADLRHGYVINKNRLNIIQELIKKATE